MQQMTALASFPVSIKRQLCLKMVFAVVADAGTVILQHGEKVDSWSVVVNGAVEWVKPSGERIEYYFFVLKNPCEKVNVKVFKKYTIKFLNFYEYKLYFLKSTENAQPYSEKS